MHRELHNVDLKLLRVFHTIVRCGGYTPAQAELNASQSTISTHMSQLEMRLGVRLCQRGHAGFKLTQQGEEVLRACEMLFGSIDEFKRRIADARKNLSGHLRFGVLNNMITHPKLRLSEVVRRFADGAPGVRVSVCVGIESEIEAQLLDRRLHLAISLRYHDSPTLEYEYLFDEEHALYCSNIHRLARKPDAEISIDDLANERYVGRDYLETLEEFKAPFGVDNYPGTPECEGIAHLILSGRYIGYLPIHYARQWQAVGRLKPLLLAETKKQAAVHAITRRSFELPGFAVSFLELLREIHGCAASSHEYTAMQE